MRKYQKPVTQHYNKLIIVDRKCFVKILFYDTIVAVQALLFLSQISLAYHLVLLQVLGRIVKHDFSSL